MNLKDRVVRLESQQDAPDRARIEADAQVVSDNIARLAAAFRASGRLPTDAERVAIRINLDAFVNGCFRRGGDAA